MTCTKDCSVMWPFQVCLLQQLTMCGCFVPQPCCPSFFLLRDCSRENIYCPDHLATLNPGQVIRCLHPGFELAFELQPHPNPLVQHPDPSTPSSPIPDCTRDSLVDSVTLTGANVSQFRRDSWHFVFGCLVTQVDPSRLVPHLSSVWPELDSPESETTWTWQFSTRLHPHTELSKGSTHFILMAKEDIRIRDFLPFYS